MINCIATERGFSLYHNGLLLIEQIPDKPVLCLGRGNPVIDMYRGNFFIEDRLERIMPLDHIRVVEENFSDTEDHVLTFWEIPESITIGGGPSPMETVQDISAFMGRQGLLPGWVYDGIILDIQGGTEVCRSKLKACLNVGTPVVGIWAQDWQGEKYTGFGKRFRWNWQWYPELYPELDKFIRELLDEGIHFLGYINPYLLEGTPLYQEAKSLNHLVLNERRSVFLVDFGEFNAGIVDFTSEAARTWYKGIIRKNLIDFGLSGWMADFGEYLPVESVLKNGMPPMEAHNAWPGFWAQVNHEAVTESGKQEDILFFMRSVTR